jgi:hypothetical protein
VQLEDRVTRDVVGQSPRIVERRAEVPHPHKRRGRRTDRRPGDAQ